MADLTREQIEEWRYHLRVMFGPSEWNADELDENITQNLDDINAMCDMALRSLEVPQQTNNVDLGSGAKDGPDLTPKDQGAQWLLNRLHSTPEEWDALDRHTREGVLVSAYLYIKRNEELRATDVSVRLGPELESKPDEHMTSVVQEAERKALEKAAQLLDAKAQEYADAGFIERAELLDNMAKSVRSLIGEAKLGKKE